MRGAAERTASSWDVWAPWVGLVLIVAAGLGLRVGYFTNGDPFVDEWATMLVARGIYEHGLPFLPSGALYGHGLLFSYLDTLFLMILGWTPVVAQLPSLIASLLTIPVAYIVARRLFSVAELPQTHAGGNLPLLDTRDPISGGGRSRIREWRGEAVGLLAAALLALDPIIIIWAGRARGYTLQQLFVLLGVLAAYRRRYLLFALAFTCALFSHEEAALLLPGFALGVLLLEGWTLLRQKRFWLAIGLSGAAVLSRWWLHLFMLSGSGGQFQPVDSRPAVQLSLDLVAGLSPLLPYFTEPYRILTTVLMLVGLAFAVRVWQRQDRASGYLLLYPIFLVTLAVLLTVVGQSWKDPRYLFMLLPIFFMLASAAAVDLLTWAINRDGVRTWLKVSGAVVMTGLLLIPPLPEALDTSDKLEEGYGPTLAYVREHWRSGDRVAGWAVPAIAVELGQIDYFAMQIGHEEFIMQEDGVWVDRWVGAPLMDSGEQLRAALDEPGRLWFLTDEFRFRARYTPQFAQEIWDRMVPVFRYHNALAFVEQSVGASTAQKDSTASYQREVQASFEEGLDLVGYELEPGALQAGGTLTVTLHWQAREWVDAAYTAFVHLLDPSGHGVTQADGPPFDGLHPTDHWVPGERLRDERELELPHSATPGRYRLEVGWYDPGTLGRLSLLDGGDSLQLAYVPVGPLEVEGPGTHVNALLGDQVELVGFDLWLSVDGQWVPLANREPVAKGDRLKVRLVWRPLIEIARSYTVFVHLKGPGGEFWGQHDGQPEDGNYPTAYWWQGEIVADEHEFVVSEEATGAASLLAGMYQLETMERLDEPVVLRQIEVVP